MKNLPKHLLTVTTILVCLLASAGAIVVPQQLHLLVMSYQPAGASQGKCADCESGGKSCDKSNSATGISAGSTCDTVGDVKANCNGEAGLVEKGGTTYSQISNTGKSDCPPATLAYECQDTTPNDVGGNQWKKTSGASCGQLDTCDAQERELNDHRCSPTPTPGN